MPARSVEVFEAAKQEEVLRRFICCGVTLGQLDELALDDDLMKKWAGSFPDLTGGWGPITPDAKGVVFFERGEKNQFFERFIRFGGELDHLHKCMTDDRFVKERVEFLLKLIEAREKNPFEMTVEEQLTALRRANEEESRVNPNWVRIPEEVFARLASTAPAWPQGKSAYRSFRIRFGEGGDGVAKTFEAHCARIQHVFGEGRYWRWGLLLSGEAKYRGTPVERLRLLNNRNHTHHAVVEWIMVDLDTNRKRKSITAVRDSKSLADELLVIAWIFPDMIRAIDYDKFPGLFAAGYEVNVPEDGGEAWQRVVIVYFNRGGRHVDVHADDRSDDDSGFSVPRLRESPALGA